MNKKKGKMAQNTTKLAKPCLRFPEFWDAPEWKEITLIGVVDKNEKWGFIGGPFGSNLKASDYTSYGIRIIQLQNIGDGEFLDDYRIYTSEQKADELLSCNIYPGDIILSKMGDPVARACLIPNNHARYVMCSDGIRLVVDDKKYCKYFIYSLINSKQFRKNAENTATGSTRKRISIDGLKNLPIFVPGLDEQQKIADCLSSLDDLITVQNQKLDTLKAHKKGLLQQLFPAEGETLPKLRFPEFRDAPEWTEKKLGTVLSFVNEKMPLDSLTIFSYISTENLLPDYGGVTTASKLPSSGSATHFKKKDVLISNIRPYLKKVWFSDMDGGASNDVIIVRAKAMINDRYLSFMLKNDAFISYIMKGAKGVKMPRGDISLMKEYPFAYPSLEEQKKIADCLFSLDNLLAAQIQMLELLKNQKKGLMQQLFPTPEEVGG